MGRATTALACIGLLASSAFAQAPRSSEGPLEVEPLKAGHDAAPAAPRSARIYRYVQRSGEVGYTDEPSRFPPGARVELTEGAELGVVPSRSASDPLPTLRSAEELEREEELLAREWRSKFRAAQERIRLLERQLEDERARLADLTQLHQEGRLPQHSYAHTGAATTASRIASLRRGVSRLEADLLAAREELQTLEREAARKAVPRHLR